MKITQIKVHPIKVSLQQPSWTAHEIGKDATLTLFEVQTDEGATGFGEVQGGPQTTICELATLFGQRIEGMDPLAHVEIWERLFSTLSPRPGGLGGWGGLPPPLGQ